MVGAGINIVPFALQRSVPGIGEHVLPAYFMAALPAVLAALCYAMLGSAMPRAGGSYVYASRAIEQAMDGFLARYREQLKSRIRLELPEAEKIRLKAMTPGSYTGAAAALANRLDGKGA